METGGEMGSFLGSGTLGRAAYGGLDHGWEFDKGVAKRKASWRAKAVAFLTRLAGGLGWFISQSQDFTEVVEDECWMEVGPCTGTFRR